jgi:hypothetical protein
MRMRLSVWHYITKITIIMEASIYRWVSVVPHEINPQFMHAEFLQEVSFNTVVRRWHLYEIPDCIRVQAQNS